MTALPALSAAVLAQLRLRVPDPWMLHPQAEARTTGQTLHLRSLTCVTSGHQRLSIPELTLPRSEVTAVIGRNSADKTTLTRTLCALEKSSGGQLELAGVSYGSRKRRELVYMVMQDVNHQLFIEHVISGLLLSMVGADPDADQAQADESLRTLDLGSKAGWHTMFLSGGQQHRIAIGSAIAAQHEILILDEPTSGLDYRRMTEVADALGAMSASGKTVSVVTHDVELVLRCCTYASCLAAGEVIESSPVDAAGVRQLREFFE